MYSGVKTRSDFALVGRIFAILAKNGRILVDLVGFCIKSRIFEEKVQNYAVYEPTFNYSSNIFNSISSLTVFLPVKVK